MSVRKRRQKGIWVSNFALLWVVFKWHHSSEGVKGIAWYTSRFGPMVGEDRSNLRRSDQSVFNVGHWLPHGTAETDGLQQAEARHIQLCYSRVNQPTLPCDFFSRQYERLAFTGWRIPLTCLEYSMLYLERTSLNRKAEPYGYAATRSVWDQVRTVLLNNTVEKGWC